MPQDNKIPEKYCCSITHQVMIDPVIAADGYNYEREAITQWLQTHDTSPKTNEKLDHKNLTTNHDKRSDILDFLDSYPELYIGDEVYLCKSWIAEFITAIKQNKLQEVQRWLDKDKRLLTCKLEDDFTALHLACEFSYEVVDILLKTLKQRNQSILPGEIGFKPVHLNLLLERALSSRDHFHYDLLLSLGAELEQPDALQNTLLHRMVVNNNPEAVSWLLEQKTVLESYNSEGNTPLLLSVIHNNKELVEFLLKKGADPKVKNIKQQTPVLIALLNRNESILCLLTGTDKATLPSLHLALELNDNAVIEALLKQKIGAIEAQDERGRTPFYSAVERGNLEAARLLLSQGANHNVSCGTKKLNVLHVATERADIEILKYLLQTEVADLIDVQNSKGDTSLHIAVQFGYNDIITILLEAGAYHKVKNEKDQTPLELARFQKKLKIANLIVQIVRGLKKDRLKETKRLRQVVLEQTNEILSLKASLSRLLNGKTPLYIAAQDGDAKAIAALHASGVNLNKPDHDGLAPIYIAAQNGHMSAVIALIDAGVNINALNENGRTLICFAAQNGDASAIATLAAAGANVNTPDCERTPICWAAGNGHTSAISALIAAGVDVNTPNSNGSTPICFAAQNGHMSAIVALIAAGANVNTPGSGNRVPICWAAENGHTATISRLIAAGANVNSLDQNGVTSIYVAADNGHAAAVVALLDAGANANLMNNSYETALGVSKKRENREVVEILEAHFKQYPSGIKPVQVIKNEEVCFHEKSSNLLEQKNPPILIQFEQKSAIPVQKDLPKHSKKVSKNRKQ